MSFVYTYYKEIRRRYHFGLEELTGYFNLYVQREAIYKYKNKNISIKTS